MTKLSKLTFIMTAVLLLVVVAAAASFANVLYVWSGSQGAGLDGSSWAKAFHTIQAGLNAAATGDQVWVAADIYMERITLKKGAALYGGFPAGGGVWESRAPARYETIIDATQSGTAVTVPSAATLDTIIDGFTIKSGKATNGAGINCTNASATITNNKIMLNTATSNGAGVLCANATIDLRNNIIQSNTATNGGGGIYLNYTLGTVADNIITKNTVTGTAGGGIFCGSSSAVIVNNTIAYNQSATRGGGINFVYYSASVANNIVAFNSTGIYNQSGAPVLRNNCVYNPDGANYTNLSAGIDDISVDPEFVNILMMNYHILETSPCVNAGYDYTFLDGFDIDGRPRVSGAHVDIGADEITTNVSLAEAKCTPDGKYVSIGAMIVSASFPGFFYVENANQTCGIRVEKIDHTLGVGTKVNLFGKIYTSINSERYIEAIDITPVGMGEIYPFTMISKSVGGGDWQYDPYDGTGQKGITGSRCISSMGMLVKICGTVTGRGRGWFYVDDGCHVSDGTPYTGIYVDASNLNAPAKGAMAIVTGIATCEFYNGNLVNVLLLRDQNDITITGEQMTTAGFLSKDYPPNPRGK